MPFSAITMIRNHRQRSTALGIAVITLLFANVNAVTLRFDSEYSPPSLTQRPGNPNKVAAYNRAAFSHMHKKLRVYIEDDNGNVITEGDDSQRVVILRSKLAYHTPTILALQSANTKAVWANLAETEIVITQDLLGINNMKMRNAWRPLVGNSTMHYVATSPHLDFPGGPPDPTRDVTARFGGDSPPSMSVVANKGVATFEVPANFLQPSVLVTNVSGAPYTPNVDLITECCPIIWQAQFLTSFAGSTVESELFHTYHQAKFLEIVTPLPDNITAGEVLPDIHVRIMSSSSEYLDSNGDEIPFPLTNGPDIDIDIQLAIAWDQKVIAMAPLDASVSKDDMDMTPLFSSDVHMEANGIRETYLGDFAVRMRATLLPGGYYGATFTGVRFLNVSTGVRLNFTMSYPGGEPYRQQQDQNMEPPQPFSRVGLGYTDFDPIYENDTVYEFFETGTDNIEKIYPAMTQTARELFEELYEVNGTYDALKDVLARVYRGYGDSSVKVSPSDCAHIVESRRRTWCEHAGYRADLTKDVGPGVTLSEPIIVKQAEATHMTLVWDRKPQFYEIHNFESIVPVTLTLLDAHNNTVISGSDSVLSVGVKGFKDDGVEVELCIIFRTTCAGPYDVTHNTGCTTHEGLDMHAGKVDWYPSVCEANETVTYHLEFTVLTTQNVTLTANTQEFTVSAVIPVGMLLPYTEHGSDIDLPHQSIKQMVEMLSKGQRYDDVQIGYWMGATKSRFEVHYVYVSKSSKETLAAMKFAREKYGLRQFIGPYDNHHAEAIGDWIAAEMPWSVSFSPLASNPVLEDTERFFNQFRLHNSKTMEMVALIEGFVQHKWLKMAIIQDKTDEPLPEFFYATMRSKGVSILSDVNVGLIEANQSIASILMDTKLSGAKVIFCTVAGARATATYTAAVEVGLIAANGYQWMGDEGAHRAFSIRNIPNAETNFAGSLFLTSVLGLGKKELSWWGYEFYSNSRELYQSNGGMDPFFVSKRGYDFEDMSPFAQTSLKLVADAIVMMGWFHRWAHSAKTTTNSQQTKWELIGDAPTWNTFTGNANLGPTTHAPVSFQGVYVQLRDNVEVKLSLYDNTSALGFNPWALKSGVTLLSATSPLVEGALIDQNTQIAFPFPSWAPNISVQPRSFLTIDGVGDVTLTNYITRGTTPVTHVCDGGCGGALINASESMYEFDRGVCVAPNTCQCLLRQVAQTMAFDGVNCQRVVCDEACQNGVCTFFEEELDTSCVCSNGWIGSVCNTPTCNTYGCVNNGTCSLPDTCVCQPGTFGKSCSGECDCAFGECNDGSSGTGECSCDDNYFGEQCQTECSCANGVCNDGTQGNGQCASCDGGWMGSDCDTMIAAVAIPAVIGGVTMVGLLVLLVKFILRRAKNAALLANMDWKVDYKDLVFSKDTESVAQSMMFQSMRMSTTSMKGQVGGPSLTSVATFQKSMVYIDKIATGVAIDITPALRAEVRDMREIRHQNVVEFVGACLDKPNICILTPYAAKGSLDNIISNTDVKLDMTFKASLMKDIARGMIFLHSSKIGAHGRLTSANCLVDSRWTVKITAFGLRTFRAAEVVDEEMADPDSKAFSMFWTAPELLAGNTSLTEIKDGTLKGDVFSFGIILAELLTRFEPYFDSGMRPQEVLKAILKGGSDSGGGQQGPRKEAWGDKKGNAVAPLADAFKGTSATTMRPSLSTESDLESFNVLARCCWDQNPVNRPNMKEVLKTLQGLAPQKGEMIDNLIKMLEKYATNLEGIVSMRTADLEKEKLKVEELVCRMLPKKIVDDLKQGKDVKAESFDSVTIFFSDIVGFTNICSQSTPLQVVALLNKLYTTFDTICDEYDAYKVETIGDAYMVVSGLPNRNGDRHAAEIATMALHLLSAMIDFEIPHIENGPRLQLRIGLHTGPVVAGVVGIKMPRYCLFGDTVNIASRMESGGLALRVHLSHPTYVLLEKIGGFHLESRGEREIKGKGVMKTYWLNGKDGFRHPLPSREMAVSESQHEFK